MMFETEIEDMPKHPNPFRRWGWEVFDEDGCVRADGRCPTRMVAESRARDAISKLEIETKTRG